MQHRRWMRPAAWLAAVVAAAGLVLISPAAAMADTNEPTLIPYANSSDPEIQTCSDAATGWSGLCLFTSNDTGHDGIFYYPMDKTYLYTVDNGLDPSNPNNWVRRGSNGDGVVVNESALYSFGVPTGAQHLWAPTHLEYGGFHYIFVPDILNTNQQHDSSRIFVLRSTSLFGGYQALGYVNTPAYASDPALILNPQDSNKPYLVYANGDNDTCGGIAVARLNSTNLLLLDTQPTELTIGNLFASDLLTRYGQSGFCSSLGRSRPYLEGPSIYVLPNSVTGAYPPAGSQFYLVFAVKPEGGTHGASNEVIAYATSTSLTQPNFRLVDSSGNPREIMPAGSTTEWTNQASFAQFNGKWILAYHDGTPCQAGDPRPCDSALPPGEPAPPMRQVRAGCFTFSVGNISAVTRSNNGFRTCMGSRTVALSLRANHLGITVDGQLKVNATEVGEAQKLEMLLQPDGKYAFRSHATGRFVSSNHAAEVLMADATSIGTREKFSMSVNPNNGAWTMQTSTNTVVQEQAICSCLVGLGSQGPYVGNSFDLVPLSGPVALKSNNPGNSKYVTVTTDGTKMLYATATSVGPSEKFIIVDQTDGMIALKAVANGWFVCTELNDGSANLTANRGGVGAWEKFTILLNSDGSLGLRASPQANGKVVTTEFNDAPNARLVANRTAVGGSWEMFTIVSTV